LVGYYRRFIYDIGKQAKSLTNLLRNDQPFVWTDFYQDAFNFFKKFLTKELLRQYPVFNKPFNITTDVSNIAIEAILSQGKIGVYFLITYASRTLNKAEKNYNTTEKDLLANI